MNACAVLISSRSSAVQKMSRCLGFITVFISLWVQGESGTWDEWWTYDGISGPAFWGLMNPQWSMCAKGRQQSPVNIDPSKLLYDPLLREVHLDKVRVNGQLSNTGQSLSFRLDKEARIRVNITGGPLVYTYQFAEMYIHYGLDGNHNGSEHQINGHPFVAEIQMYGFNSDLYHNMSEARFKSQGMVGLAVMIQVGETSSPELRILTSSFNKVIYRGQSVRVSHLSLVDLLPGTQHYMTYEGSTTHPGCWETTTWIVMNKPIYMTRQELYALRKLMQGDREGPKAPLGNNVRPLQPLHHRTVRTNIDFAWSSSPGTENCPSMHQETFYKANVWAISP